MTHEDRPATLADQAAAWVPPWARLPDPTPEPGPAADPAGVAEPEPAADLAGVAEAPAAVPVAAADPADDGTAMDDAAAGDVEPAAGEEIGADQVLDADAGSEQPAADEARPHGEFGGTAVDRAEPAGSEPVDSAAPAVDDGFAMDEPARVADDAVVVEGGAPAVVDETTPGVDDAAPVADEAAVPEAVAAQAVDDAVPVTDVAASAADGGALAVAERVTSRDEQEVESGAAAGGLFEVPADPVDLRGPLEAILMIVDEPVSEVVLAQVLDQPTGRVVAALEELAAGYAVEVRGFELRRIAGGWRYYTRGEFAPYVERFVLDGQQVRLTQAALETLAVIAYKQPVTRSRISAIRGVNCDGVVRTLTSRGLIEECGSEPDSGAFLYRTTTLFLEKLGLNSVDELPPLAPFLPDDVDEIANAQS